VQERPNPLADAVAAHTRPGDTLHLVVGHHRWSAAARELVRHWWGRRPGFTLVMLSLSSLGALFFRGGLVRRVLTGYSGDTFPSFTPNPWFQDGYDTGRVEVEHWSFLALTQRLEAAARGLPAVVTRSIGGSSMEANDAFARLDTPFGEVGLLAPLAPDVTLMHAPLADRAGNLAVAPPALEGFWGALAARRGVIASVEAVVDDLRPWSGLVRIPAHRVLAVGVAPLGAHPGGCFARDLPVEGYAEDYDFWIEARAATRRDDYDDWIRRWILEPADQNDYLGRLGPPRVAALRARAAQGPPAPEPPGQDRPPNAWEHAAVWGARTVAERVVAAGHDAVLAGAGVANLAAWLGVRAARSGGSRVELCAEIGLWGYDPVPGDPFVLNHHNFPTATVLADASFVLGVVAGGAHTRLLGCLGAAQVDRDGNLNTTRLPGGPTLVGSGGGNDVASVAEEVVVVTTLRPDRTPERCGYVTSPGRAVTRVVTDLGILGRDRPGDVLRLVAVPAGGEPVVDRVRRAVAACGWPLEVTEPLTELAPPTAAELAALRSWDPNGWFLRD
jgi:acyl CoA:acetate/3-ketoacid CoA transferase beta subunit/acyl CoA:acetate/3-ketoacid CoA transferase alpha subunit